MNQEAAAGRTQSRTRQHIGRYTITGRIGRGGMGMVYRGVDAALEREVAVKTLTLEGTLDEETRRRFEVEAKAAAKLQHPNIVTVFELGEDRGVPFIAMELLPGTDLEALVRSGAPLLLLERLDIVLQTCRGLHYAHEHRVVHRDVKPSNIRLLDDGTVKIMDFGIAKLGGVNLTRTGVMVGTVHYMSPEQIHGQPLDGRSDVFSAGVILYELLAGRRPFEGGGATEILYKIVKDPVPPLPDLGALTPRLQGILDRALAKDPAARYAGANRMAEDLAALRGELQTSAPAGEVMDLVHRARRLLREGRGDDGLRILETLVREHGDSVDVHRAFRAAQREAGRRQSVVDTSGADVFPELEVTFQAAPTRRGPDTVEIPRTEPAPTTSLSDTTALAGRTLLVASGIALVVAVVAGLVLLGGTFERRRSGDDEAAPPVPIPLAAAGVAPVSRDTPGPAPAPPAAPAPVPVRVESEPSGAAVTVDGRAAGVTPLEAALDPAVSHRLVFTRDGYRAQHLDVPAGAGGSLRAVLQAEGPPATVHVASSYPVEVTLDSRVLAKGQASPRILVPPGRQTLTIAAPAVFLKMTAVVEAAAGRESRVDVPATGQLNVQAIPDSCQVFVNGQFVDYPPILGRPIAAGRHVVSFRWTDGVRREEAVLVEAGEPMYVTGRKQ